ncbi:MAG: hypothetical protein ACP6IP_04875 [Candidatus Njordarchaeia archaeon]
MKLAPTIILALIILHPLNSQVNLTFGSLGFDFQIFGGGHVFRDSEYHATFSARETVVIITIYYILSKTNRSTVNFILGVNNQTINIDLTANPTISQGKIILQKTNQLWINVTVENANLTVYKNSTIQFKPIENIGGSTIFKIAFYLFFIVPIVILIYRRLRYSPKEEEQVIVYGGD